MMNLIKVFPLVAATVTLFPTASFADNFNTNTQEANINSTVIGNGNVVNTETRQSNIQLQRSGRFGANDNSNAQRINAHTTVIGDGNIDIKKAIQSTINRQQTK